MLGEEIVSWELLTAKRREEPAYSGITSVPTVIMSFEPLDPAMPEVRALLNKRTKKFTLLLKTFATGLLSLIIRTTQIKF